MKIAIVSDSHDKWGNLERAIEIANNKGCKYLLHAGDLIAPPGISVLEKFEGNVIFVWGNNEAEKVGMTRKMDKSDKISLEGDIFEGEIEGLKIFMNHYPRIAELVARSGEFDLCIHGHNHEYKETKVGDTLLMNPGEIQGYKTGEPGFVIFDTGTRKTERKLL